MPLMLTLTHTCSMDTSVRAAFRLGQLPAEVALMLATGICACPNMPKTPQTLLVSKPYQSLTCWAFSLMTPRTYLAV
ncbi:hypothetical protein D3C81_1354540 [compost metagenome]